MAYVFGQRFWSLDVYQVRQRLLADPILHSVSVEKIWPDEVQVVLKEVTPVARFGQQGLITEEGGWVSVAQYFVEASAYSTPTFGEQTDTALSLSNDLAEQQSIGKKSQSVLAQGFSELGDGLTALAEPRRKTLMALPLLVGEVQSRASLIEHYRLLRRMGWPIARLELTARGAWKLVLQSGVMIELGSQHFSKRVHKVATIMQAYQSKMAEMQKIDARYPNGVAVKWRGREAKTQQVVDVPEEVTSVF